VWKCKPHFAYYVAFENWNRNLYVRSIKSNAHLQQVIITIARTCPRCCEFRNGCDTNFSKGFFKGIGGSIARIYTALKILSKTSRPWDKMHADTVAFSSTKYWTTIVYQTPPTATVGTIKRTKTFLFSPSMAACFDIRYVCTVSAGAFYAKLVDATDKNWQNSENSWQPAMQPLLCPPAVNFKPPLPSFSPVAKRMSVHFYHVRSLAQIASKIMIKREREREKTAKYQTSERIP